MKKRFTDPTMMNVKLLMLPLYGFMYAQIASLPVAARMCLRKWPKDRETE